MREGGVDELNTALRGRYVVRRLLGAGGMAEVYLADDLKHDRKVAIKVLRAKVASFLGPERFLGEIQVTARLQHPHIVPLFDSGEAAGFLYYVMPYVEGESLRERLSRDGGLETGEAKEIARQVGSALQYAHEQGIVHRGDIKPENVMLQAGQAVVADFGIALAFADTDRTRFTSLGQAIGTPGHMSPEQAAGEPGLDERTDIYALGALLFEMLSGAPPYTGTTAREVVAKVISGSRPSVTTLVPAISASLEETVETAMAQLPGARFDSVAQLLEALERDQPADGLGGMSRRTRWVAAALLIAAIGLGGVFGRRAWRRAEQREWARMVAIPEIQGLLDASDTFGALQLALRAQEQLPDDPTVAALLAASSLEIEITSEPAGAEVRYRRYTPEATAWVGLGRTPLERARLPDRGQVVVRLDLPG